MISPSLWTVAASWRKSPSRGIQRGDEGSFADAFTDYVTVFNIRPAQCELLFPVVTVRGPWDTAISVTNPAYEDEIGGRRSDVHLLWDRECGGDV